MKEDFQSRTKLLLSEENHNFAEDDRRQLLKGTTATPLYQMKIRSGELKAFKPSH